MIGCGIQLTILQNGTGGKNSGDAPFDQFTGLGSLQLIANRHLVTMIEKFGEVSLRCVERNARHRHVMPFGQGYA